VSFLGTVLINAMLAIGMFDPRFARLVRSTVITVKELEYVVASPLDWGWRGHVCFSHIIPNFADTADRPGKRLGIARPFWTRLRCPSSAWAEPPRPNGP